MFKTPRITILFLTLIMAISCKNNAPKPFGKDPALENKRWELTGFAGSTVQFEDTASVIYLVFEGPSNTFGGNAGCNQCNGMYTTGDDMIKIHTMAVTKMTCPSLEQESKFLKALEECNRYELKDKKESGKRVSYLQLFKDKDILLKFKAR